MWWIYRMHEEYKVCGALQYVYFNRGLISNVNKCPQKSAIVSTALHGGEV